MRKKPCLVCAEKDKTITILAEQIDWLRARLGTPTLAPTFNPSQQPLLEQNTDLFMTDEEADIREMVKNGAISEETLPDILEALGFANTDISLA